MFKRPFGYTYVTLTIAFLITFNICLTHKRLTCVCKQPAQYFDIFPPFLDKPRAYLSADDDESVHFLQMTPSHVVVQQCTGGCTQLEPSCLPSRTRTRRIPVLVAKCGITLGQRMFGLDIQ